MVGKLVACPSCATHVLASDAHCPQCGGEVRNVRGQVLGRTASAVLMGLALAGCPAEDDPQDTMGGSGSSSSEGSSSAGSTSMTSDATTSEVTSGTSMGESSDATTFESSAAYGVPATSTGPDTETDTDTDTDTGATST